MNKRTITLVLGIVGAIILFFIDIPGLPKEGRYCMAISFLAVLWWTGGVMHPGYTSILMLLLLVMFKVATPAIIFGLWTSHMIYLIIGSYLIASAVGSSGLGKRLAYWYASRYITSYKSMLFAAYFLGFLLSFFIPLSFARSFLVMGVLSIIARDADMPQADMANLGLAVFAGSVPVSLILLTGDSPLSLMTIALSGQDLGWLGWVKHMSVPGIVATVLTFFLQLKVYKPVGNFVLNRAVVDKEMANMGPMKPVEWRTLLWCSLAVILWMTQEWHTVPAGWVALGTVVLLALPYIGGTLGGGSWNDVPLGTLFFILAALSIGTVGKVSGMNQWLADSLLPAEAPSNLFLLAGVITVVGIILHMCIGSCLAVLSVTVPTFVAFGVKAGLSPIIPALLCFTAVYSHFLLPFHHMNVLVGIGEKQGGFTDKEVLRLGIPLTIVPFILTMVIQIPMWTLFGLL